VVDKNTKDNIVKTYQLVCTHLSDWFIDVKFVVWNYRVKCGRKITRKFMWKAQRSLNMVLPNLTDIEFKV